MGHLDHWADNLLLIIASSSFLQPAVNSCSTRLTHPLSSTATSASLQAKQSGFSLQARLAVQPWQAKLVPSDCWHRILNRRHVATLHMLGLQQRWSTNTKC